MNLNIRKFISTTLKTPELLKHKAYQKFPNLLGLEVKNNLVQFYRNDKFFKTAFSFNHFIEFFSQFPIIDMKIFIQVYDRNGRSLGIQNLTLQKKGATQFYLNDFFTNLDEFGIFTVSLKLDPSYVEKLFYLGTLAPQFMTMYVPHNQENSPQMVHSHKHLQGYLWTPRNHVRHSGHVEILSELKEFQIFILNSCKSNLTFKVQVFDSRTNELLTERKSEISGYATSCLVFKKAEFKNEVQGLIFKYFYNRSVDHKKPIIFRHFLNDNWSCNHT